MGSCLSFLDISLGLTDHRTLSAHNHLEGNSMDLPKEPVCQRCGAIAEPLGYIDSQKTNDPASNDFKLELWIDCPNCGRLVQPKESSPAESS